MAYATLDEYKYELYQADLSRPEWDDVITDMLDEASAFIDTHCFRTFVVPTTESIRYYSPNWNLSEVADLDDIANTTGLAVAVDSSGTGSYSTITVDSDYFLETDNVTGMVTAIRSSGTFPLSYNRPRTIKVTARFGWPSVPTPIRRACIIEARRLFNRKENPSGIIGFGEFGGVRLSNIDPDVKALLAPYVNRGRLLA